MIGNMRTRTKYIIGNNGNMKIEKGTLKSILFYFIFTSIEGFNFYTISVHCNNEIYNRKLWKHEN